MADQPDMIVDEFTGGLDKLAESVDKLESVLDILFETLASKGLKPTAHLNRAMAGLRRNLNAVQFNGQQVQLQLGQLREFMRTGALITSSLELEQVLEEVMDTVITLAGAERAYLMLYDDAGDLQIQSARNWDRVTLEDEDARFSRSIIDAAIQGGIPVITTNAQTDDRFESKASVMIQQLRSILCIPLAMRGQMVGVLYADNRFQEGTFREESIPILTAFGSQAAIAIQNAKAFGAVREDLAEAEREIYRLRIELDQSQVDRKVSEITDTAYFQELSEKAKEMREGREKREG